MGVVTRAKKRRLDEESINPELIVRRFSISWSYDSSGHFPVVDSILGSPRLDNLQEFELFYNNNRSQNHPVPRSVLCLSHTLRVLSIRSSCDILQFPMETACMLSFPYLKELALSTVNITDNTIHCLLSKSPVLESLVLDENRGCRRLRICSLSLWSLGVSDTYFSVEGKLEEVIIENAPLLERLIPRGIRHEGFVIRVIQAPKLKTLGYLSDNISTLELGTMVFQKVVPVSLSYVMRAMKILALNTAPNLDVVIDFLNCFPCVEKLYIVAINKGNIKNVRQYVSLEFLDLHLRMVEFINYQGDLKDLNFIKFLLNARVLECIKFVARRDKCDAKWIQKQHQRLQLYSRASQGVTLDFQADYRASSLVHMKHICDLTKDDPFDRSFCRCRDEEI